MTRITYERAHYTKGSQWMVTRAGAYLFGWQPIRGGQQGCRTDLTPGMVLTCDGTSWTGGDGVPALKWTDQNGDWIATDCTFYPTKGGMWGGQVPADGFLLPHFDNDRADEEGWAVFHSIGTDDAGEFRIERYDEASAFPDDEAAWRHVARKAREGSDYHAAALQFIQRYNPDEWLRIKALLKPENILPEMREQ